MRVLVACEFSGVVREAFRAKGHEAWSCDLEPAEDDGPHIQWDVLDVIQDGWDLMIAHPPCTYLCSSGARWWRERYTAQALAIRFVMDLVEAPIEKIAIENPIGILSKRWREPDQIIHPYYFGDPVSKATCLWLQGLPLLQGWNEFKPWEINASIHEMSPSPTRSKDRSRTFQGIANAMAEQWG